MTRGFLLPHIPFLLPELGGNKLMKYVPNFSDGINQVKQEIQDDPPDFILVSSPHFTVESFAVGINSSFMGNLENFRRPDIIDIRKSKLNIGEYIQTKGEEIGFMAERTGEPIKDIDYGSIVALRLIDPQSKIPIIPISASLGTQKEHYLWGKYLFDTINEITDNSLFLTTTELTQDFNEIPNAYPTKKEKDEEFLEYLTSHSIDDMLNYSSDYFANTENNLRPLFTLAGFSERLSGSVINYSGIIGCGSAIVKFEG